MFDAILLMAGDSNRSKLNYNKAFYELLGLPLYQYSLNTFLKIKACERIILVVRKEDQSLLSKMPSKVEVTIGGLTRQESVANGIKLAKNDIVLIHDVARCNVCEEDIMKVYEGVIKYQACVVATKTKDTIKEVEDNFINKTLNRDHLWSVQTPQGVMKDIYQKCLQKAINDNYTGFDDVELLEKYGNMKVRIVEGRSTNIKVTTPEDFKLMEFLLKEGL